MSEADDPHAVIPQPGFLSEPAPAAVLAALPRELSPLVQVAMIDFVVATRAEDAAAALDALVRNPQVDAVVREAASRGLAQL